MRWVVGLAVLAVLAAAVLIPSYQGYKHRGRIAEAIGDGFRPEVKAAVEEGLRSPAKPGLPAEFRPASPYVKSINVDRRTGTIFIALDGNEIGHPEVEPGAYVSFTAIARDGAIVEWKCGRKGVAAKLLPAACR